MRVVILGAGAWGTTLANLLAANGRETTLWTRNASHAEAMRTHGENQTYLPGFPLHQDLAIEHDPARALNTKDIFLLAVPSQKVRATLQSFAPLLPDAPAIVCASKGIELSTLAPMSRVVAEALAKKQPRYAMLSGPSFANEVSRRLPTSVSLGCAIPELATELQAFFSTSHFRVYTTPDVLGVELGGAVKNVIAIAAGIADGLGFGHDARAALITRGIAEISRLGMAMGAQERTFMGLSGMGDLVLTCTGDLSRNRQVGLGLGQGKSLTAIVEAMNAVAEGVKTTASVHALARKLGVEMPIVNQMHAILYENMSPNLAVRELMGRELKEE